MNKKTSMQAKSLYPICLGIVSVQIKKVRGTNPRTFTLFIIYTFYFPIIFSAKASTSSFVNNPSSLTSRTGIGVFEAPSLR